MLRIKALCVAVFCAAPNRTQSFGQIVRSAGPLGGIPGSACNPTKSTGGD